MGVTDLWRKNLSLLAAYLLEKKWDKIYFIWKTVQCPAVFYDVIAC